MPRQVVGLVDVVAAAAVLGPVLVLMVMIVRYYPAGTNIIPTDIDDLSLCQARLPTLQ